jgi:hypothetical protein
MRTWKLFAACSVAVLFSTPAAARFGYCTASIPGKDHQSIPGHYNTTYPSYVSAIIDFGDGSQRVAEQFARQFSAAVGAAYATCYNHLEDASGAAYYRSEALEKGLGQHVESAWTGGSPAAPNGRAQRKPDSGAGGIQITGPSLKSLPTTPGPAAPKYVEATGPDGKTVRLSPEVAARNKAAEQEYQRKTEEHQRKTKEREEAIAQAERDAAQKVANAAAEKRAYEQKLAINEAQVAAHAAALEQHRAATKLPAKGAKGWMYCDARGAPGDKRRYYSRVTEIDYVPGEIPIIDVMAKNRPAFKSYVAGTHSIFFATDSLLHCPYSTTSMADAEALMARDKRDDGNQGIEIVQTGWVPTS